MRSFAHSARPLLRLGLIACAALLATGCSILKEDKIDYKTAQEGKRLDVPPDLTQLSRESRYVVPGSAVTASGFQAGQANAAAAQGSGTATVEVGDVRIERAGSQRWLVVNRPAGQLWGPIRDFWQENGFLLETDQETLGIMETDWAENRAKLPQDIIRRTIGRLFDSLYSTGEYDKFRTRLERNASGGTEIYITHRGMVEVYANQRENQTAWQPRPADPELEAEFLRRLMVKLGVSETQAQAVAATAPTKSQAARVTTVNNRPALQFEDNFDRAWRRVGLSLDRSGFTVEDRNRSEGTYFVRYVEPAKPGEKPGFFARMFGADDKQPTPQRYRIVVKSEAELTTVSVLDAQGQPDGSANAQRIVQLLAADL
ncbi:MAG: outer membrane protein assembly factor BamC [Comamonadaceae bacterium]|uniref:outer membrane protein assembly factor BamC n=1 Tax=Hydrogenophaga sp. SNF1 TaxID=3098762 RepID=UPI002ACC318B|nr:outer membrane protein assembly factor BamC [Hydrogenophaga sp. SNF1]NCT96410.1 outer membrane protein assembly factor BamC [Comamonadaceae bacterium]WQB85049.1 outer membrane protein assembly factor BamC [Hydrogenophaga sp. SNF1]